MVADVRELLWSTFLPWVRMPGAPAYRAVGTPPDLPGYRPYDAGHELPGATLDESRARKVCARILAAEPERIVEITALLDRLGLDARSWDTLGAWFRDRPTDEATPSLALDLGLLLGHRILEEREGARWEPDAESEHAYPQVVLGVTVIALPLQAVEAGADLDAVLTTALEAPDAAAVFVTWLDETLADRDEPLTADELDRMLAECGLDELPDLPDDLAARLDSSS